MRASASRPAFTLIELLVVVGILGALIGLLLPAVQKVRESANRSSCGNNLKQIGLALQAYVNTHRALPAGYRASQPYSDGATDTAPGWGWAACILPFLEQSSLFRQLPFDQPIENAPAIQTVAKTYLCPSDLTPDGAFLVLEGFGKTLCLAPPTSYAACCGSDATDTRDSTGDGVFYRNSRTRLADITDGTSTTLLVGERAWAQANASGPGRSPTPCCSAARSTRANPMSPAPGIRQARWRSLTLT
jgi:prepilin-type N-terminal cleavage/methylation domain-containing protein